MTLTDDAKLVAETIGKMRQAPGPLSVLPDGYDEACLRLAKAYIEAGMIDCEDGCPACGAKKSSAHGWDCGTVLQFGGHVLRSWTCQDRQIARLTAKLATVSADLADHQQRLMRQSDELNAVRQERAAMINQCSRGIMD